MRECLWPQGRRTILPKALKGGLPAWHSHSLLWIIPMRTSSGKYLASLCLSLLTACQGGTAPASTSPSPKISPQLEAAVESLAHDATTSAHTDPQGRLQVYVYVTDTGSDTLGKLTQAGLVSGQASPEMGVVQGWIAPQDLDAVAALSCVKTVTLPLYASPR